MKRRRKTGWRDKVPTTEDKKLEIMRAAKTNAESRYGLGGRPKRTAKPVTLPKTPWDTP